MVRISGIEYTSLVDGPGIRTTIFVSGCKHNCPGCHNASTHDFSAGVPLDDTYADEIISNIKNDPLVQGVTLSGGDPMYSADDLLDITSRIRALPNISSIWIYSGFCYEDIIKDYSMLNLLRLCDVLVDGEFHIHDKDLTHTPRGSNNQRIIDIQKSLSQYKIVLYDGR